MTTLAQDTKVPLWIYVLSVGLLYVASAILVGRDFASKIENQIPIGCLLGIILCIPLTIIMLPLQVCISVYLKRHTRLSLKRRSLFILSLPFVLLLSFCIYSYGVMSPKRTAKAFETYFRTRPSSVDVISYDYERTMSGDGSHILIFKLDQKDVQSFMTGEGYVPVAVDSNPNQWRLSLCNDILRKRTYSHIELNKSFICYSKETETNGARIYYDAPQNVAVFIGYGKMPLPVK